MIREQEIFMKQYILICVVVVQCASFFSMHAMQQETRTLLNSFAGKEIVIVRLDEPSEKRAVCEYMALEKNKSGKYDYRGNLVCKKPLGLYKKGQQYQVELPHGAFKLTKMSFNKISPHLSDDALKRIIRRHDVESIKRELPGVVILLCMGFIFWVIYGR